MQSLLRPDLRNRAFASLALLLLGAIAFALTSQDSWIALTGLLASLAGVALLYRVIRMGRVKIATPAPMEGSTRDIAIGLAFALLRTSLILVLIVAAGAWIWFSSSDMNEIRMLLSEPRYTDAQVIGKEIVRDRATIGYVHFAYRVSPTLAPEDRFAVPYSQYSHYRAGLSFEVTYSATAPRVHRVGHVTWELAVRRLIYWLLLLANGAAYLFLPLWLLRFRKRAAAARQG